MRTLSSFVEYAVRKVLTDGFNQEPFQGAFPPAPKPMWHEGLWDEDQADRLFLLATGRPDLLTVPERTLWKVLSESILLTGKKLNLQAFRAAYNDPMVNKTHLAEVE